MPTTAPRSAPGPHTPCGSLWSPFGSGGSVKHSKRNPRLVHTQTAESSSANLPEGYRVGGLSKKGIYFVVNQHIGVTGGYLAGQRYPSNCRDPVVLDDQLWSWCWS